MCSSLPLSAPGNFEWGLRALLQPLILPQIFRRVYGKPLRLHFFAQRADGRPRKISLARLINL